MRRVIHYSITAAACLAGLSGCGAQPGATRGASPQVEAVRSLSAHYVLVELSEPVDETMESVELYQIVDPESEPLSITDAQLSESGTEIVLTTGEQLEVQYQFSLSFGDGATVARSLGIGALGFLGTSLREPFLESAVSLSSTQILLTFSNQMDRTSTETVAFYEIADPDGNTDLDIRITAAALQSDYTTVILTTTPQANVQYIIRATNVKRRFSCEDEGRIFLDEASQGTTCAASFRPRDAEGTLTNFALTSRTQIDRNAPLSPTATGIGGSVGLEANGAGVRRPLCTGGTTGIDGANGSDPDEELIFTADRPEQAENIVIGLRSFDTTDAPVLFISSSTSAGFDYVINTPEIRAAFSAGASSGDIVFSGLPSLPPGLKVDAFKLRETNGEIWVHSVCGLAINRRLIDPTRNTAQFWGIPPVDTFGPRVVRAQSISDTEVIVSFSEPLNSDAANPVNFTITPELTVIDARLGTYDTQVILTTSPQRVNVTYTVTVANVRDKAGNLIDPLFNSATFSYAGGPAGLGADVLPRVVGAASTGNTGVLVVFSKPMGDSAIVPGNYFIVQQNVNPEVGTLVITGASFLDGQQDAVQLVTSPQNEVTYFLRAANVRDLFGNQLAPPQLLVDPSTAVFPGTPFSCGGDPCDPPDSDEDGVQDHAELRGYVVKIELNTGETVEREVTSDPASRDTDGDGLTDGEERRIVSDPRLPDTDADQLEDFVEYNVIYSSPFDQDTDNDTVDDLLEVDFFKTNALVPDSDGDGFNDDQELYVMNRDPRIADLPSPRMSIGSVKLQLQETFSFTDENGRSQSEQSSSTTTMSASTQTTITNQVGFNVGVNGKVGVEGGYNSGFYFGVSGEIGASLGFAFQHTSQSARTAMQTFETSLSKGFSLTGSSSSTRQVTGGRVDAMVSLGNLSNVAFSLTNLEITVSAPDPTDRSGFVPVATLIPNSSLITGDPATYNIGVLNGSSRGPILFTSRDVFPTLVEDLLRDPRGLVFEFANYDLSDEFGRNFAFASQTARDRTVGLVIDSGDGNPQRYFVAFAPVRFSNATCDTEATPGCDIVGGFAGFADANIPPFGGIGPPPGLPLEYILNDVLQLRRSEPVVTPVWMAQPPFLPETSATGVCVGGANDGEECDPANGNDDCDAGVCDNSVAADGILVGNNGTADSIAAGDDEQLIPAGIDGLPEDAVVITAGEDGVLQTAVRSDDVGAVITGYATTRTCGAETPGSIQPGPNGVMETVRDPFTDDQQAGPTDVILPGANGFIDTAPGGDDVFVGPGIPCDEDSDCFAAPGACDGQESLFRFERRARGQFGRAWAVLLPDDALLGLDFRKVVLRPGDVLNLGFIQDNDRDGLISDVEALFGSSDGRQDTDGDRLDDFSEVRVGWEVGVDGQDIRRVFPDPRFADTDRDGLSDREEQDFRRVQCECDGGSNDGESCTLASADCPGGGSCENVADMDLLGTPCGSNSSLSRIDPRLIDTDADAVTDAEEVLGWLTQAAVIDPKNVVIAGANRIANATACPQDVCSGGSMHGEPCRFDRDCGTLKVCTQGVNDGIPCENDIECQGPTPALSGLCSAADSVNNPPADPGTPTPYEGVCNRTTCDDVQVVAVGTPGLDSRTVVVAPGKDGALHAHTLAALGGDTVVANGNLRAATAAIADDQQVAAVDPTKVLDDTPLGRLIVRPGINGALDTLQPTGDDVMALGQYIQTTNPLKVDTDLDLITDGFERLLGSDPRNASDGGLLADRDGDGLTDQQEQLIGWTILVDDDGVAPPDTRVVFSNPNVPDSDLDGLPDLAEFRLRTDPRSQDTDGDGLGDFDEVTDAQLAQLAALNGFFPGYVIDPDNSAAYGTSALACDTDGDLLTDDFELLVGFDVTLRSDDGIDVFHVFTDPTNDDTDFDGLRDGAEYKHTVQCTRAADCAAVGSSSACIGGICAAMPPTDPTRFDSDGDGRKDGDECDVNLTPPDGCAPLTAPLARCDSNPLVPDKRVTIRFVELIMDRDQGGDTNDLSWQFGAHKSNEPFPGTIWAPPLTTTADDCSPPGTFEGSCGGHISSECILRQGDHVVFGSDALGFCASNSDCQPLNFDTNGDGTLESIPGQCNNGFCSACFTLDSLPPPFNLLPFCFPTGEGKLDNERTFSLRPGEGVLIYGKVLEFDDCPAEGPLCAGGPNDGGSCRNGPSDCCALTGLCVSGACSGGPNNGASCATNGDCIGTECGECQFQNAIGHHMVYFRALSFESLTEGFTVDVAAMRDQGNTGDQFQMTVVVEITVE